MSVLRDLKVSVSNPLLDNLVGDASSNYGQVMGGYSIGKGEVNSQQHALGRQSNFVVSEYLSESRIDDGLDHSNLQRINDSGLTERVRPRLLGDNSSNQTIDTDLMQKSSQQPHNQRRGSADQSSVIAKRFQGNQKQSVDMQNLGVRLSESSTFGYQDQVFRKPAKDLKAWKKAAVENEDAKSEDDINEQREELQFYAEAKDLKAGMAAMNTKKTQDAMGEPLQIKKIHTREMSKLFRSKKEIYQILLIEGQFYLPPIEDCTIDYLRDIFSGRKKVSISHCLSISKLVVASQEQ